MVLKYKPIKTNKERIFCARSSCSMPQHLADLAFGINIT